MIAAERDRPRPGLKDSADMGGQRVGEIRDLGIVEGEVAVIHDVKFVERRVAPAIGRVEGLQRRGLAQRAGTEAGAGAVRHRLVEGHAGDGEIDAGQVFRIAAAEKAGGAAEGVLEGEAATVRPCEGEVDLALRVFQSHERAP